MQKLVNGVLVDLKQEEIALKLKEEQEWEEGREKREALERLKELDNVLPRYAEVNAEPYYDSVKAEKALLRAKLK